MEIDLYDGKSNSANLYGRFLLCCNSKKFVKAKHILEQLIDSSSIIHKHIAHAFLSTRPTSKLIETCMPYIMKLKDKKNVFALVCVAKCYLYGICVEKNNVEAVRLLTIAADQEYADAQFMLGWCYAQNLGVVVNSITAFRYYMLAANQGHASANNSIGLCYERGFGIGINKTRAIIHFMIAAHNGCDYAISNFERCSGKKFNIYD